MQSPNRKHWVIVATGILACLLLTSSFIYAAPAATPPGGNVDANFHSISVGTPGSETFQAKADGSLTSGSGTNASGTNAVATGEKTIAEGYASTAMGYDTAALGVASTTMGYGSEASGHNSTAMGSYTRANGEFSTAIGYGSETEGDNSTAIGLYTKAQSVASVAIGKYNIANGNAAWWLPTDPLFVIGNGTADASRSNAMTVLKNGNVGIGNSTAPAAKLDVEVLDAYTGGILEAGVGNNASGDTAIAMGYKTSASAFASTAIGRETTVSGDSATAMGYKSSASGFASVAMGNNAVASSNNSTAIGREAAASGPDSTAIGYKAAASGQYSVAMGQENVADWPNAVAMGYKTKSSGTASTAMGYTTTASGIFGATAMGQNTTASGNVSTAMGNYTKATGGISTTMGNGTTASGSTSTAMGQETIASGWRSTTMGYKTEASSQSATAMGENTAASGIASTSMGFHTKASTFASLAIGMYNVGGGTDTDAWKSSAPADPVFEIGNGTGDASRSNILTVLKNGNVGIGTATPSYQLQLSTNSAAKPTSSSWTVSSDIRLKNVEGDYQKGLAEIMQIHPVRYKYKEGNARHYSSEEESFGFVAQEVMIPFPESVHKAPDGYLDFDMHVINVAMVKAVQELKTENDALKAVVCELKPSAGLCK